MTKNLDIKETGKFFVFFKIRKINFLILCLFLFIEEALHLATLLCRYGYYFHVAENNTTVVKEDGELYRFQVKKINFNCNIV